MSFFLDTRSLSGGVRSAGVVTTRNHQNDRAEAAGYVMLSSSQEDVWSPQGVFSRVLAHFFRHRLRTDLIDDCHRSWFHEESRGLLRSSIKDALIVLVCVSCSLMQRVTWSPCFGGFNSDAGFS